VRDEALAGLGLHPGDAVSVDTRAEPHDGDLVVVEVELEDDSLRTARRFFQAGDRVRLESVGEPRLEPIDVPIAQVMIMGVIAARLRLETDGSAPIEEPLEA